MWKERLGESKRGSLQGLLQKKSMRFKISVMLQARPLSFPLISPSLQTVTYAAKGAPEKAVFNTLNGCNIFSILAFSAPFFPP